MGEVVTKGDFARLLNVSAGRVSQYISEGKIFGPAIVGEGMRARIDVDVAREQLRSGLDTTQRFSLNGLSTRLDDAPAPVVATISTGSSSSVSSRADSLEEQIKREKLAQARMQTERQAEERAASAGRYVLASAMREEAVKVAARMLTLFEGAISDMAGEVTAAAGAAANEGRTLTNRDITFALKGSLRKVRERAAREIRDQALALPETVLDSGGIDVSDTDDAVGMVPERAPDLAEDEIDEVEPA
ncbi:hypothetical protein [Methylobrevis pamukkalensis]|uniref:Uncharacterized protein n=1 Tax=Methylobrevis pamukkalensis TaxID=1439726 RepID=A0A1E3H1M1_9HYPH|nr:hypothetical protein [Methylobrevis pamukkalensis]ODN70207.1 hypothetical protein A6302_02481 [Methylobrevis pamukkalensis]